MITPETLTRHELVGLPVRVVDASSADAVGIGGRVLRESQRTLTVRTGSGDKRVPKAGTTFEFALREGEGDQIPTVRSDECTEERAGDEMPARTEEPAGDEMPARTEEPAGEESPARTDEAADCRKASGSTSELGPETAGVRPRQSGPSVPLADDGEGTASRSLRECDDVVYVTVDGDRLLSRPAERTERGVSTWR